MPLNLIDGILLDLNELILTGRLTDEERDVVLLFTVWLESMRRVRAQLHK